MTILQTSVPYALDPTHRLPGVSPTDVWFLQDEAYAAQMAERERLLTTRRADVLAVTPDGEAAAHELLDLVLDEATAWDGFYVAPDQVICPDGRMVSVDRKDPMGTLGRLVQEDLCLHVAGETGHVLAAAVLCFPASWRLDEKIGRSLHAIHAPVPEYDDGLERRVQRMFDAIRVGQVLMRHNLLWYDDPTLFQPRSATTPRERPGENRYMRTERQTLRRLPKTGAVVFGIHTYVLNAENGKRALSDDAPAVKP